MTISVEIRIFIDSPLSQSACGERKHCRSFLQIVTCLYRFSLDDLSHWRGPRRKTLEVRRINAHDDVYAVVASDKR